MHLALTCFGPFQAALAGKVLTDFRSGRVQNLLIYLALEGSLPNARPHSRTTLATLLWPDEPERAAKQNLRQTLYQLRQLLGEASTPADQAAPFLRITNDTVQWNPAADYSLDVVHFLTHLARGEFAAAVELYSGELLTGLSSSSPLFEEWLLLTRERFHMQVLDIVERLTQGALQQGDYQTAQRLARRQLALEPWRENAHQQLMRSLALAGERSAALAQYESCRRLLAEELGVEPAAATVALYQQIRTGALGQKLEEQQPEARSLATAERADAFNPPLATRTPPPIPSPLVQDWGEAPEPRLLYGRQTELAELTQWLLGAASPVATRSQARLVTILGMGGMGKTTLAVHLAQRLAPQFEVVIWRSLLNAPPLTEIIHAWLQLFAAPPTANATPPTANATPPAANAVESLDTQLNRLFELLRRHRCLLVLDNAESIMQTQAQAGRYRPGYEAYGQLFRRMGESSHQSCLLITSREQPQEVARLERTLPSVRTLALSGLAVTEGETILQMHGVHGTVQQMHHLITHYSGNPLALLLVVETIQALFDGDIAAFLQEETPIFDDIRDVLDQHFVRLSTLERDILFWLAIEREALTIQALSQNFPQSLPKHALLDALNSLRRRALLEKNTPDQPNIQGDSGGGFTLQNVVMEYVTDTLINQIVAEIEAEAPVIFKSHALLKAGAREYVRQSQVRLLLQPILERLLARLGRQGVESRLRGLLPVLRGAADRLTGYGGGNLLNLLLHLQVDLSGADFSTLAIWQAYLPGAALPGANFAGSDFKDCVFADTFGVVVALAFHPNGRILAAGTANDGKVRIWRLADGQCLAVLDRHTNIVWTLAFSADGALLASGSQDHTVCLWDTRHVEASAETIRLLHTLTAHTGGMGHLAFTTDGRLLASTGADSQICLWESATGRLLATLHGQGAGFNYLAFNATGTLLTTGGKDCIVWLWDVAAALAPHGRPREPLVARLSGPTQRIWALAFSPDGRYLASGSWDGDLCLWDLAALTAFPERQTQDIPLRHLQGHTNTITTLVFRPDGRLISTSEDRTLRVWDVPAGGQEVARRVLQGYNSGVWYTAISFDGQLFAGGGGDRNVRLWALESGTLVHMLHGHAQGVMAVALTPDGALLAAAYQDHKIRLWDSTTHTLKTVLHGHTDEIEAVAWGAAMSGNPLLLASGDVEQKIHLWDLARGRLSQILVGHTGWIYALAFHRREPWLVSASGDAKVRLWHIDYQAGSGTLLDQFAVDGVLFRAVAVHSTARVIAAGCNNGAIYLWQQSCEGKWLAPRTLLGHTYWVASLAFSPDGEWLVSGSYDRTIRLWHWRTGELVHVLHGHTEWVWSVAFHPQPTATQQWLASCGSDNTVRLWEVHSGQLVRTMEGHTNWVRAVTFSPDGAQLISGSSDETIKWWDMATGDCLATLRAPRPYEGVNLTSATGLTPAQRTALKALGALDTPSI